MIYEKLGTEHKSWFYWRGNRSRDDELTLIHPVNDGLHGALWGVTLQNNAVSLLSFHTDFLFFLLGRGNCTEANEEQMHTGKKKGANANRGFLRQPSSRVTTNTQTKTPFVLQKWRNTCESCVHALSLLITTRDALKRASRDINSRALLRKRLSGKLWGKEVAQERASHTGGWIIRGALYFRAHGHVQLLIIKLLHVFQVSQLWLALTELSVRENTVIL